MPVFNNMWCINRTHCLGVFFILTFFIAIGTGNKASPKSQELKHTGRLLGFLKPKQDYTDINLGFELPIPDVKIPYPIYKIGYQDILPFKTWLTINPLHIAKALYKLALIGYEFASRLWLILWNTIDIFRLSGAFFALNKHYIHGGWASTSDFFEEADQWR